MDVGEILLDRGIGGGIVIREATPTRGMDTAEPNNAP